MRPELRSILAQRDHTERAFAFRILSSAKTKEELAHFIIQTSFEQDANILRHQRRAFPTENGIAIFARRKDFASLA